MDLIQVRFVIKNFPSCMNRVSDNNDFGNVLFAACLVNATSNGKELGFYTSDKSRVVNCLDQWMIISVNVGDGGGNVILDARVSYNNCCIRRRG